MKKLMLCAVAALLLTAGIAPASMIAFEEYAESHSWSPGAVYTDDIGDHIQMMVSVSGGLETPSLTSFSWGGMNLNGWTETYNDGTIAVWDTDGTDKQACFKVWFDDALKGQTFTWYLQSWKDHVLNPRDDNAITIKSNMTFGTFGAPPSGWNPGYVVPVPAAVLLGMLGLSVAGVKLRKFA